MKRYTLYDDGGNGAIDSEYIINFLVILVARIGYRMKIFAFNISVISIIYLHKIELR